MSPSDFQVIMTVIFVAACILLVISLPRWSERNRLKEDRRIRQERLAALIKEDQDRAAEAARTRDREAREAKRRIVEALEAGRISMANRANRPGAD